MPNGSKRLAGKNEFFAPAGFNVGVSDDSYNKPIPGKVKKVVV